MVCFEQLRRDPALFHTKIATFLGVSVEQAVRHSAEAHRNASLTSDQHEFLMRLLDTNSSLLGMRIRAASKDDRALFKSLKESGNALQIEVPDAVRRRLAKAAAGECRWLSQEFNLPLEQLGYPLCLSDTQL